MKINFLLIYCLLFSFPALGADFSDPFDQSVLRTLESPRVKETELKQLASYTAPVAPVENKVISDVEDVSVVALPAEESFEKNKTAQLPVLSKNLARGEIVKEEDISFVEAPKYISPQFLTKKEDIIGREANKLIGAERPIKISDLRNPTVVSKGSHAEISYITDTMELKDLGEVMQDGAVGDVVQVKNVKSGKIVQARVESNGSLSARLASRPIINQISSNVSGAPKL